MGENKHILNLLDSLYERKSQIDYSIQYFTKMIRVTDATEFIEAMKHLSLSGRKQVVLKHFKGQRCYYCQQYLDTPNYFITKEDEVLPLCSSHYWEYKDNTIIRNVDQALINVCNPELIEDD